MFRKMFAFVIALSLFSVTAQASTQNGLKAALDELNYSLNVEWDQKDQTFYKAKVEAFSKTVAELQAQGLSNADVLALVKAESKDANFAKEMETALGLVSLSKMAPTEASNFMKDAMSKSSSQGANWSGGASTALLGVGILLVIVAVIAGGGAVSSGGSCDYICSDYYGDYCC